MPRTVTRIQNAPRPEDPMSHRAKKSNGTPSRSQSMINEIKKQNARNVVGPYAADRRTDPRYKFTAHAGLVEDKSGKRIETRVDDLSRRGCYLSTQTPSSINTAARVRVTKGTECFEASARVMSSTVGKGMGLLFTEVDPEQHLILTAWLAGALETSGLDLSRRRSRRVSVRIPVRVSAENSFGSRFEEETYTQTLSAHGALIFLSTRVIRGQSIHLSNSPPNGTVKCTVADIGDPQGDLLQVGVTFVLPNQYQLFWDATFPSPDRSKRYLDTKLA